MNIFITTAMRTGSTWICDLIAGLVGTQWVFWERGRDIKKERFQTEINKEPRNGIHVFKMHFTPPERICECIKPGDKNNFVISITRDIRDTAVSKILYLRKDKNMRNMSRLKEVEDMRKSFGKENFNDKRYINAFIQTHHFKHIIKNWKMYNNGFKHDNYMLVHYEVLHKRRLFTMFQIANFVGIVKNNKQLRQVIIRNNFRSKSGRVPGQGDNNSFRRKGIIGDHKNYMNDKSLQKIEDMIKNV